MAKGFKHGAGGGTSLNFKVVGNPQPANPKANTIWVNTDEKITGWDFSATQPENLAEGMVWFSAGTSSHIPFNALKKNGLMVYPMTAKQYINGAWVYKEAKIYQGGSWVNLWDGYLYKDGNEYTEVTGGWDCFGKRLEEWSGSGGAGTPIMTRNVDSLTMATAGNGSGTIHYCKNKIDLTNYNTLKYIGTLPNSNSDIWHMLCVWSEFGAYCDSNRAAWSPLDGTAGSTLSIDISALSGEFYIGFSIYTSPAVTMTKLWLE